MELFKFFAPIILFIILVFGLPIYFFKYIPKRELCKIYYPEISTFSCLLSDYGLPTPRRDK